MQKVNAKAGDDALHGPCPRLAELGEGGFQIALHVHTRKQNSLSTTHLLGLSQPVWSTVIACAMNGPRVEDQTAGYSRRKTGRVVPPVPSHQACSPWVLSPSSTRSLAAPSADDGVTVCRPDKVQVYQRYGIEMARH